MEEPGRLQSTGSQRVGHDLSDFTSFFLSFFFLNQEEKKEKQVAIRIKHT